GHNAIRLNTTSGSNIAIGSDSLYANTTRQNNTAVGSNALMQDTDGRSNTAIGINALYANTVGKFNTAIGFFAGFNLTTGDDNIDFNNPGVAGEGNTTRIGDTGHQTRAFVAGIRGITTGVADAIPVVIDSAGQLGTVSSSRRYKFDVADIG